MGAPAINEIVVALEEANEQYSLLNDIERQSVAVKPVYENYLSKKAMMEVYNHFDFRMLCTRLEMLADGDNGKLLWVTRDTAESWYHEAAASLSALDSNSQLKTMWRELPVSKDAVRLYGRIAEQAAKENALSENQRKYVTIADELFFTGAITDSILEYLKTRVPEAIAMYNNLTEEEKRDELVVEAARRIKKYEDVIGNESNLSEKARTFVLRVKNISYSLPFTLKSFTQFQVDVEAAAALYKVVPDNEKDLLVVSAAVKKLEDFQAVVDREINLSAEAKVFVDAVDAINQNPNATEKDVQDALALYEALSNEDKSRVYVAQAKTKLETIQQRLEVLSPAAKAFVDAVDSVKVPDNPNQDFWDELAAKLTDMQRLYGGLSENDQNTFAVKKAVEKMISYVDMLNGKDIVHYDVQYYANIPVIAATNENIINFVDTSGGNLPVNGNKDLPQRRASIDVSGSGEPGSYGKLSSKETLEQVYTSSAFDLVNRRDVSYFDKLKGNAGYTLSEVWVLKNGCSNTSVDRNDWTVLNPNEFTCRIDELLDDSTGTVDSAAIVQEKNVTIRFVYELQSDKRVAPVSFYDYDITDGAIYKSSTSPRVADTAEKAFNGDGMDKSYLSSIGITNGIYVASAAYGINSPDNYDGTGARLAFGNANTGTDAQDDDWRSNTLNRANTRSYSNCTFGLVKGLNGGAIQYADGVNAPNLFNDGNAIGKTPYTNGEFSLVFDKLGDTYTLSGVNKGNTPVLTGLDEFLFLSYNWNKTVKIWTNNFWPMDYADSFGGPGNDIKFGTEETNKSDTWGVRSRKTNTNFPKSDDGILHNAYFGMNFAVDFRITSDYTGRLEYYFYGDDDLWVFLDGQLVCDIGGTHASVGEYVNLWDYIEMGKDSTHTLSVFYTERGASGSTCYMQYTLPSATLVMDKTDVPPLPYNMKLAKKIDGINAGDTFSFSIKNIGKTDGVILPANTTVQVMGGKTTEFDAIRFTKGGIYQFEISEINNGLPGYRYDDEKWTVTITVKNLGSMLYPQSVEYANSDRSKVFTDHAEFMNEFTDKVAVFAPQVIKEIKGQYDGAEDFVFSIAPKVTGGEAGPGGEEYPGEETEGPGEVTEESEESAEATDETEGPGEVTEESEESAETTDEVEGSDEVTEESEEASGGNSADGESEEIGGEEESGDKDDTNNWSSVTLPEDLVIHGPRAASFGNIVFRAPGVYEFEIREIPGESKYYKYDKRVWTLRVTVIDDGEELAAFGTYLNDKGEPADAATFVNAERLAFPLPSTGGQGTSPIYTAAAVAILIAAAYVVRKKKIA